MNTSIIPSSVLKAFRHFSTSEQVAPDDWVEQFVDFGLMYRRFDSHPENTGLGEEILDELQHDRHTWEPLNCEMVARTASSTGDDCGNCRTIE